MKDKIIEKQKEIIKNLKEVGTYYFEVHKKGGASFEDVQRMRDLTAFGAKLESELSALQSEEQPKEPIWSANSIMKSAYMNVNQSQPLPSDTLKAKLKDAFIDGYNLCAKSTIAQADVINFNFDSFFEDWYSRRDGQIPNKI